MFQTIEIRWFCEGTIPPQVLEWFRRGEQNSEEQPHRTDYYFHPTEGDSLGIKLREGRIEIKQRHRQNGAVHLYEGVAGTVEHWRKWSFELVRTHHSLSNIVVPDVSWIGVKKKRRLRRYRLADDGKIVAVATSERPGQECALELTQINVEGREWWTVGFETFGSKAAVQEKLLLVAQQVFAVAPPTLAAKDSYGYPKWLGIVARGEAV